MGGNEHSLKNKLMFVNEQSLNVSQIVFVISLLVDKLLKKQLIFIT